MVLWSTSGHVALVAFLLFDRRTESSRIGSRPVMTISLGGAPGPRTGGLTQMGARAVQEQAPPDAPPRPAMTPPAPTPPKMTLPDPKAKPRPQPKPRKAPPEAARETREHGPAADRRQRARRDCRRSRAGVWLEQRRRWWWSGSGRCHVNFCCPDYLAQLVTFIQRSWDQNQGVVGSTTVKFTIARDGTIQAPQVEKPSGFIALDNSAHARGADHASCRRCRRHFQNPTPDSSHAIRLSTVIMNNNLRSGYGGDSEVGNWERLSCALGLFAAAVVIAEPRQQQAPPGTPRRIATAIGGGPCDHGRPGHATSIMPCLISSPFHPMPRKWRKRSARSCGTTSTSSASST